MAYGVWFQKSSVAQTTMTWVSLNNNISSPYGGKSHPMAEAKPFGAFRAAEVPEFHPTFGL
jgi:hypothetical protein